MCSVRVSEPVGIISPPNIMWCNAAVRGLTGHQLATAWVKVLGLCSSVNNEVGLLEAVIILVVTVKFG